MTRMLGAVAASLAIVTYHGTSPRIFLTSDGRSWRDVTPQPLRGQSADAFFVDPQHGWVVTNDCAAGKGALLRTADGGRTWKRRGFPASTCNAGAGTTLQFLDHRHGFAVHAEPTGPGETLSVTDDGGVSWRFVGRDLPVVGPVTFRTRQDGWLGGLRLYRTRDGGRRWQKVRLPVPQGHGSPELPDAAFAPPVFHGRRALLAAAFRRSGKALVWVYSTRDFGRHWIVQARFHAPATAMFWPAVLASAPAQGVEWVASVRRVYLTADDGADWSRRTLPRRVERLDALDGQTAVVQTTTGATIVTHDGGRSWRRVTAAT